MTKARDLANAGTALTSVSATELGYLDGVTSAVQTQLNAKQAVVSGVNDTEIGYLDGVTSAIQTQLNAKAVYPSQTGNSGKYLTTDGTNASWGTVSSGALTLITSGTLSGSSTTFSNCFSSTYDSYVVYIFNMERGGSATRATVTLTEETSYYKGSLMGIDYAGAVSAQQNNNGVNPWVTGQISSSGGGDSIIWDIATRGASGKKFQSYWRQYFNTDPINYYGALNAGTAQAVTGFTLGWNGSGSWASGTVRIYGVAK